MSKRAPYWSQPPDDLRKRMAGQHAPEQPNAVSQQASECDNGKRASRSWTPSTQQPSKPKNAQRHNCAASGRSDVAQKKRQGVCERVGAPKVAGHARDVQAVRGGGNNEARNN